jgi:hypothetical protein
MILYGGLAIPAGYMIMAVCATSVLRGVVEIVWQSLNGPIVLHVTYAVHTLTCPCDDLRGLRWSH